MICRKHPQRPALSQRTQSDPTVATRARRVVVLNREPGRQQLLGRSALRSPASRGVVILRGAIGDTVPLSHNARPIGSDSET